MKNVVNYIEPVYINFKPYPTLGLDSELRRTIVCESFTQPDLGIELKIQWTRVCEYLGLPYVEPKYVNIYLRQIEGLNSKPRLTRVCEL